MSTLAWPVPPEIEEPEPRESRRAWGKVPHSERYRRQRSDLLRAAARLVSSRGYQGTRIADIVAEAGLSKGTFYEHFKSKEDCFVELYRRTNSDMLRVGIEAAEATFDRGAFQTILAVTRALTAYVARDPRLARAMRLEAGAGPPEIVAQGQQNQRRTEALFEVIARRLGTAVPDEELRLICSVLVRGVQAVMPDLRSRKPGLDAGLATITRMACRALGLPES